MSDTSDSWIMDESPPAPRRQSLGDRRSKQSHPKLSDTSDTSIISDSPPVARRKRLRKDNPREQSRPKSIKRSHLLAALSTLESDLKNTSPNVDPLQRKFRSKERLHVFTRCCSLDLSTRPVGSWSGATSTSKIRLLTYTLTNSIFRHDWSTAAQCLRMMLDMERCCTFVYRTLLLVLFNHPNTNSEIVDNFLSRVLNLRTRSEQLTFLRQTFLLPDGIEAYTKQENAMSAKIQDEGMTTSEDE